jgi:hypothetical protein
MHGKLRNVVNKKMAMKGARRRDQFHICIKILKCLLKDCMTQVICKAALITRKNKYNNFIIDTIFDIKICL